jgi:uncharacterized ion transporter superfamily protein YfcC
MPRLRFPHSLTLLVGCILLAAALTYVLPAGEFQRREDPATGRSVVVSGTYARVEAKPVTPFAALIAIPKGFAEAASVIALVFLVGAAFAVVERVGTLGRVVEWLVARLANRGTLVIPVAGVVFSLGGILMQTQEELIAFVPALLLLSRQLGFTPLAVVAMSLGTAAVGAAFSPVDPFQVLIAQRVAQLPSASGASFRLAFLVPAVIIWIWGTSRYANRTRTPPAPTGSMAAARFRWQDLTILGSMSMAPSISTGSSTSSPQCSSPWACWREFSAGSGRMGRQRRSSMVSGRWPMPHS